MDSLHIIEQDGYTFDDLTFKNQEIMRWLRQLLEDAESYEWDNDGELYDSETVIGQMEKEIADCVAEDFRSWLERKIAAYQIYLIENQPYEDTEDV